MFFLITFLDILFVLMSHSFTITCYGLISFLMIFFDIQFSSVQFSHSVMSDSAHQASLSITNSQSLHNFMSIEMVMLSNYLILCHPLLLLLSVFPSIRVFPNESVLPIRWPNIGVSASASVLPMNIWDWFPLGWTGWISLQSKGLSRVFNTTVQMHQFFST